MLCKLGWVKRIGRLYHLNFSDSKSVLSCSISSLTSNTLWHYRLGHPSPSVLQHMSRHLYLKSVHCKDFHCSICHLAKQKRLSFVSNNNLSSSAFDLIHVDIWGPFNAITIDGFKYLQMRAKATNNLTLSKLPTSVV